MKNRYFLISFLLISMVLNIFLFTIQVQASDEYQIKVKENQEVEYKVTLVKGDKLENIFGIDWREDFFGDNQHQLNAKKKIRIDRIETEDYKHTFKVTVDIWDWVDPDYEFNSKPTSEENNIDAYKDPNDYVNATISDIGLYYVPTNVKDYLAEIDWEQNWDYEEYSILFEGKVEEKYKEVWTHDKDTGILKRFEILDDSEKAVYRYEMQLTSIPGYDLSIFLAVSTITTIGIILYIKKKKVNHY